MGKATLSFISSTSHKIYSESNFSVGVESYSYGL